MNIKFIAKFVGNSIVKICKKSMRFVCFFAPLLLMQAAVAGEKLTQFSFKPTPEDISVTFLKKIFGTVGGALIGTGSTIMGQIFYVFNCGILVVIGSVLFYTISKSIVEIAHGDPSQMGRKFNWWMPARVVMGIGMIVPNSAGYSFLNVVVMWMVLQGVGLADSIWAQVVNYIGQGGALYSFATTAPAQGESPVSSINLLDLKLINGTVNKQGTTPSAGSSDILRSQLCMYTMQRVLEQSRKAQNEKISAAPNEYPEDVKRAFKASYPELRETYDDETMTVSFPGNAKETLPLPGESKLQDLNGICGKYTWEIVPPLPTDPAADKEGPKKYQDVKKEGITSMVVTLKGTAQPIVNDYNIDTGEKKAQDFSDSTNKSTYTDLVGAAALYQTLVREMRIYAGNGYMEPKQGRDQKVWNKELEKKLTEGGWVTAGTYFFKLAKLTELQSKEADKLYYAPNVFENKVPPHCIFGGGLDPKICAPDTTAQTVLKTIGDYLRDQPTQAAKFKALFIDRLGWYVKDAVADKDAEKDDGGGNVYTAALMIANKMNEQTIASAAEGRIPSLSEELKKLQRTDSRTFISRPLAGYAVFDVVLNPLNEMLSNIGREWYTIFASSNPTFPLLQLQMFGKKMIDECFNFWGSMISKSVGYIMGFYLSSVAASVGITALAPGSFWGTTTGAQGALAALMQLLQTTLKVFFEIPIGMIMPVGFAISVIVITNGALLYFYLPLIPFMLFLFGIISWLSFVIEGMVATPLIALGLTHPEGHDLLGKADQALMLMVAMFIRPTALIIGLIAGIVLSYVAMDVLNAGFGVLTSELFATTAVSNPIQQATTLILVLVYTLISISLMQQCFSLINVIPARITRWIGISGEMGPEAQLAEAVKAGVGEAAGRVGGAVSAKPEGVGGPSYLERKRPGGGGDKTALEEGKGGGGGSMNIRAAEEKK